MSTKNSPDDSLRPHIYDGIQEYDKRLPNWWLMTLYGTIAFAAGYWILYHQMEIAPEPAVALEAQMKENQMLAAKNSGELSDPVLWSMSRDAEAVAAGKTIFETTCASCHMPNLMGGIGPNLVDNNWIHGGKPVEIAKTITDGVAAKGMPSWAPILGKTKVTQVTAYILSHHKEGEPVNIVPSPAPGAAQQPAPGAALAP